MLNQEDNKHFVDLTEQVLQILLSEQVIPIKRLSENHYLHLLFAGMIVTAYLTQDDIYMYSRRSNVFVERSVSTLYFAAAYGSLEMFEFLLKKVPITTPPDPVTLLQVAVMFNSSIDHMKESLRHGVDINAQMVFGYTALQLAVSDRSDEIVLFLLDNGADASIKDDSGDTPSDEANTNNNLLETTVLRLFKASQD